MTAPASYQDFLRAKVKLNADIGFPCESSECHELLKPHQRDIVAWAVRGGRRAIFSAFGLGKTVMQLEAVRLVIQKGGGIGLIVCPLGVRQEFKRDAGMLGTDVTFVRTNAEVEASEKQLELLSDRRPHLYLTNYESVREGKISPQQFTVVSLDEAAILRGFGGTKTFREFMATMAGDDRRDCSARVRTGGVPYRFVATATPSPNEYIELLAYGDFLGVMETSAGKTRFFKRDSTKADNLTLHPHKEHEFWLWVASWAVFLQKPSDLGYVDDGYDLPDLDIRWHEIPTDHRAAGKDRDGQARLFKDAAIGVVDASREKRDSLAARVAKMMELRAEDPGAHRILWHDLEDERRAIEAAIPSAVTVYGSQDLEERERSVIDFSDGTIQELAGKPVMLGSGCNFQRHCNWAIFVGIGFKFSEIFQAVKRLHRFLQKKKVRIDFIYTEAEREVRKTFEAKWVQHEEAVARMTDIIREFGLSHADMTKSLTRSMGVARREASGPGWTVAQNDCVDETNRIESDSLGLILTSVPFATQYEYSPSYNDFGHTDDETHFFRQMDYLTPELYRALKPGRILAVHCKDRIKPMGLSGMGFQTVTPFSDMCSAHYREHGFGLLARITIETDVVRENAQTYRLGWSEQCKDGSRMGNGLPEYLLVLRKPPTDRSRGYADEPVIKSKDTYSRGRWQFDADGFHKSSGNRLLSAEDFKGLAPKMIYRLFKRFSASIPYDHERAVALADGLDKMGLLPPSFKLMQLHAHGEHVWTEVVRMRTLNTIQAQKRMESHICPVPFDIIDRAIAQYSNKGDEVYDPFGGLFTVPLRAVRLGRRGRASELSASYFDDGVWHLQRQDSKLESPTLFDLETAEAEARL